MQEKVCSFFGHREIDCGEALYAKIENEIKRLILNGGITKFLFGGYGEFDLQCHTVVTRLKEEYPFIKRIFCYSEEKALMRLKRIGAFKESEYEETLFLPLKYNYWYTRIYYRNCEIINASDCVIFYVKVKEGSGAYKALQYAQRKRKDYKNLALD